MPAVVDGETADDTENTTNSQIVVGSVNNVHQKTHVDFKEATVIESEKESLQLATKVSLFI